MPSANVGRQLSSYFTSGHFHLTDDDMPQVTAGFVQSHIRDKTSLRRYSTLPLNDRYLGKPSAFMGNAPIDHRPQFNPRRLLPTRNVRSNTRAWQTGSRRWRSRHRWKSPGGDASPSDPTIISSAVYSRLRCWRRSMRGRDRAPLVLAVVLKLLLQPAMRLLRASARTRINRGPATDLAVFGVIVGLGAAIAGPASTWAAKFPEGVLGFRSD